MTFKASADHLSFNQLDDRIKLKGPKWARRPHSLGQLRMTPLDRFRAARTSQTERPLLAPNGHTL